MANRTILIIAAVLFLNMNGSALGQEQSLSWTGKLPPTKGATVAWGKDPFSPLVKHVVIQGQQAAPVGPALKLTAVFYNNVRPSALINDRIVYKGSVVYGQKVIDIGKTHVILQGESGSTRLEIAGIPELP